MGLSVGGSGDLDSTLAFLTSSLDLNGTGDVRDGEIVNWGWLKEAAGGITQLSFVDFNRIPIKDVVTKFQVENGKIHTKNLTMTAADIPCKLNGFTDIETGGLNYALDLELPADRISVGGINVGKALGSFFGGKSTKKPVIPLQISIKGTSSKPEIGVSVASDQSGGSAGSLLNRLRGK